jgi:hypothetical protein
VFLIINITNFGKVRIIGKNFPDSTPIHPTTKVVGFLVVFSRKDREKESLNFSELIKEMYKTIITLKNGGYWTQEELGEMLVKRKL